MTHEKASAAVPAADIAKVRKQTRLPWKDCKRFLMSLTVAERQKFLAAIDGQNGARLLHDPVEDDPSIRPLFLAAADEARREVEQWHKQRVADMVTEMPELAEMFRRDRGLCHRIWHRTKEILKERHGIEWRSPAEMNPGSLFD